MRVNIYIYLFSFSYGIATLDYFCSFTYILMGIVPHRTSFASLTPLGEACSRKDLIAIHEVLENIGYQDDEVPIGVYYTIYLNHILMNFNISFNFYLFIF
jgi:hypothetical protein